MPLQNNELCARQQTCVGTIFSPKTLDAVRPTAAPLARVARGGGGVRLGHFIGLLNERDGALPRPQALQ